MLFSIITVVKNDPMGLQSTLQSLIMQTFPEFEVIIKDYEFSSKSGYINDARFYYINGTDSGIFNAMNLAASCASGEYLLFLNAGDSLMDTLTLEWASSVIKKIKFPDLLAGNAYVESTQQTVNCAPWLPHQSTFIKNSFFKRYLYREFFKIYGDLDLWQRIKNANEYRPVRMNHTISRFQGGGISQYPSFRQFYREKHWIYGFYSIRFWLSIVKRLLKMLTTSQKES